MNYETKRVRRVGFLLKAEGEWFGVCCRARDLEYVRGVWFDDWLC